MTPFDDEFELNDSDFDDDAALTAVDEAKLDAIEAIQKCAEMLKENIKFKERSDYSTNFRVLSRYVSAMVDLDELENGGTKMPLDEDDPEAGMPAEELSEEEILERIQQIKATITEVGVNDLRQVNPDEEEGTRISLEELTSDKKDDDDGSLDF